MMGGYLDNLDKDDIEEDDLSDLLDIISEWLVGFR